MSNGQVYPAPKCPILQADATLNQANPVSTTLYTVLRTANAKITSIATNVTWAVNQPTPLEVVLTIDGQTIIYIFNNPVSATNYEAVRRVELAENAQTLQGIDTVRSGINLEGRRVLVQARVTWAITQPSPLVCRVKYAKW